MQLVAYGAQDIYLTGNPQITFFKVVYRRHTNFAIEAIRQTFNGSVSAQGSSVTSTISRNGDLLTRLWIELVLKTTESAHECCWTNNTGHAFIKECEIEIGGQRIDRHTDQWLNINNELNNGKQYESLALGRRPATDALNPTDGFKLVEGEKFRYYIPLKFWFCENPGLALPLIALQYHEVKLKLVTRSVNALLHSIGPISNQTAAPEVDLYADYIYLDTDERRRFAQVSHEYLIEQVQIQRNGMNDTIKLNLNHPVKSLIWTIQDDLVSAEVGPGGATPDNSKYRPITDGDGDATGNDYFNYEVIKTENASMENVGGSGLYGEEGILYPFSTMHLQLNGHERFSARHASYFMFCQRNQAGYEFFSEISNIFVYSFALKPREHQPSGTCNFSRIDNAKLVFTKGVTNTNPTAATEQTYAKSTITVYATNYNVLRIMSGMAGLAYSN